MITLPRISTGALLGAAFVCLAAATTGGCAQDEYPGYGYEDQYVGEPGYIVYHEPYPPSYPYGPGYSYYGGGYWHDGHHGYWHHDRDTIPKRVPRDADVVAQGQGAQTYTADKNGTVYVRDAKNGKVLYRGRLKEGETFTLDPSKHRATVDGDVVRREITRKGHENQVYFDPRGDGRRGDGNRTDGGSGGVESRRSESPAPRAERGQSSGSRSDSGDGGRSEGGRSRGGGGNDGGSGDRKR
jgi:hypothetical protein